jgi:hypothetical protein
MNRRISIISLVLLVVVSIGAPSLAFAQELLPTPDMTAPLAMITFGILGLVGGVAGYVWRHRPNWPGMPGQSEGSSDSQEG